MKKPLIGLATPEQIAEWKKTHGDVYAILAGEHICYVKKPNRATLSYVSTESATDPLGAMETLLDNCWIDGSEAIKTDDALFLAAAGQLNGLIEVAQAKLVKC